MRSTRPSSGGGSAPVRSVRSERGSLRRCSTTASVTSAKSSPPATGSPSARPSHSPFRIATPLSWTSREARVTSPAATAATVSRISAAFSAAVREPSNATSAARPAVIESVATISTGRAGVLRRVLGREADVRVVRQEDHLVGRELVDRGEQLRRRRVRRLAALDDRGSARPARRRSRTGCDSRLPRRPRRRRSRRARPGRARPRAAARAAPAAPACSRSRSLRSCRPRCRARARRPDRRCGRAP